MLHGGPTQLGRLRGLQQRLDTWIACGALLSISFARSKASFTHLQLVSGSKKPDNTEGIQLAGTTICHQDTFKLLGVIIDHHLTFKEQAFAAASASRRSAGLLWYITKCKGASPATLHHLATQTTIPTLLWGSEVWWTGARHLLTSLAPAYNSITPAITDLPKWTPLHHLRAEGGLPPLDLMLNKVIRRYTIRTLLAPDNHPCKPILITLIKMGGPKKNGVELKPITELLCELIPAGETLQNWAPPPTPTLRPPSSQDQIKMTKAVAHKL